MKMCSYCKEFKDESQFHKCTSFKDGLQYGCIQCKKIISKKVALSPKNIPLKRVCSNCKIEKDYTEFHRREYAAYGLSSTCKVCKKEDKKKNSQKSYIRKIKTKYNLSLENYTRMLEEQNNCCYICGKSNCSLAVDHCHETNKVRSLLCRSCNSGLGFFKESIQIMKNAISYIEKFNEICVAA